MARLTERIPDRRIVNRLRIDDSTPIDINVTNDVNVVQNNSIDSNNSTSTPLGVGGVFTGSATDVTTCGTVTVSLYTDQISATDGAIEKYGDIDYPSKLMKPLLKRSPSLIKLLPRLIKD